MFHWFCTPPSYEAVSWLVCGRRRVAVIRHLMTCLVIMEPRAGGLNYRLTSIIRNAFIFKNGNDRYKYLVLGHEETYFEEEHSDSKNKYSEDDIIKMLEFLVDNIFVVLPEKSSSRQSAFQWVRIVPLSSPTSFFIHTKRISYSLCSQRERNI